MITLLWVIAAVLVVLWLVGMVGGLFGNLMWVFIVIAALLILFSLFGRRRVF